ncbi:hypothetical protein ABW20_dc0101299 [Dactylellina cionopaga]|nr:hypothetical protein ABW20_dc0101299 [Dactylellina cionopaga]
MKVSTLFSSVALISALANALPTAVQVVDSNKLQSLITRGSLETRVQELYAIAKRNGRSRALGSGGAAETLDWIEKSISKEYYSIERQPFDVSRMVYNESSITVDNIEQKEVGKIYPNGQGTVTAPVILTQNFGCNATDYTEDVAGKITLVRGGGGCKAGDKMYLAGKASAAGFLLWDDQPSLKLDGEDQIYTTYVPAVDSWNITEYVVSLVIGRTEGQAIFDKYQLAKTFSKSNITIHSRYRDVVQKGFNIIATTKGGNQNAIITIGAHTDSVEQGPGINDNGSGTIAQLEVAKALTGFSVNNAIRFCFWSGEELGLLGSENYMKNLPDAEAAKIVMNLDFDMLASPNYIYGLYSGGEGTKVEIPSAGDGTGLITQAFKDFFKENGNTPSVPIEFDNRSDYAAFLSRGIPVGGLAMGAEVIKTVEETKLFGGKAGEPYDACYHRACDDDTNINYEAFLMGAKSIAYMVAKYGKSIEGFPFPRTADK